MSALLANYRAVCRSTYISPSHRRNAVREVLIEVYKALIRRHGAEAVVRHAKRIYAVLCDEKEEPDGTIG